MFFSVATVTIFRIIIRLDDFIVNRAPGLNYLGYFLYHSHHSTLIIIIKIIFWMIVLPLSLAFLGYLIDIKKYPYTKIKIIYVFIIIFFISIINIIAFLELGTFFYVDKLNFYNSNYLNYSWHYKLDNQYNSFGGLTGCKIARSSEIEGSCYGYFAVLNNDVSLCGKYIEEKSPKYKDKKYLINECIIDFSLRKNDEKYCIDNLNSDVWKQKCFAIHYIAKKEFDRCDNLVDKDWRENCFQRKNRYNELQNISSIIKKYAEIRGLNEAKEPSFY